MFISALVFQLNLHFLWMKQQIMFQHNLKRSKLYCWWKRRKKKTEEERFKFLASSWIKSHESCSDIPHRTTEKHCCLPFIHKMRWKKKTSCAISFIKDFFFFSKRVGEEKEEINLILRHGRVTLDVNILDVNVQGERRQSQRLRTQLQMVAQLPTREE